jgi:hypothetical protein
MFSRIGLCVDLKNFFSQANGVAGIGALNLFFFIIIIILSEWSDSQCVTASYRQGSSTQSLLHFVGLAYQDKDIVLRFIIEYSSIKDFYRPLGNKE